MKLVKYMDDEHIYFFENRIVASVAMNQSYDTGNEDYLLQYAFFVVDRNETMIIKNRFTMSVVFSMISEYGVEDY